MPRLLNQAAHQALNLAAEAGAAEVDAEAALEALALLGLSEENADVGVMPERNDLRSESVGETEPSEYLDEMPDAAASTAAENHDSLCRLILASERVD